MDLNKDFPSMVSCLKCTFAGEPHIRKPAEHQLVSAELKKDYSLLLLKVIDAPDVDPVIKMAAAIAFKNFVRRNWKLLDEESKFDMENRETVKEQIVGVMLRAPPQPQRQLSDSIALIGREDFPAKWPSLLPIMVGYLNSGDFNNMNGILQTAHCLFKRYRYEFKSQVLWEEIKLVLDMFAQPLTDRFKALLELKQQNESNTEALKVIYESLVLVAKVFCSLNHQDLAEFFEDNMELWMTNFHALLITDVPLLKTSDTEDAGVLEHLKAQICENIGMYAQKYDEEFAPYLPNFVTAVWNLLLTTGNQTKYDLLVSVGIQFLALVADRVKYKQLFENPELLSGICEKIIIPNMEFRESDEELFEDNPEDYIRRDVEGSDVDTRRRAACDLVRSLGKHFEPQITSVFGQYVGVMLSKYSLNPAENWKDKDAAIYLVTSLSAKGQTQKYGVTMTNQLVDMMEFFKNTILPDLTSVNVNQFPVLKADAIKYVMIFRNQLSQSVIKECIPYIVNLLQADSAVVHTYAAICIEKILLLKQTDNTALVKSSDLSPVGQALMTNLFNIFHRPVSKENDYVMRAIMRSISALQEGLVPMLTPVFEKLATLCMAASKNPSKPHFNHYIFESITLCIKIMTLRDRLAGVTRAEAVLFPIFQVILSQDIGEFVPYVFQLLSFLMEMHTEETEVPSTYMRLFPCLLTPSLWEKQGNIHPLVRLFQSYITVGIEQIIYLQKLNGVLGIFQKLIASKANDHEGFALVQSLVEHAPEQSIADYVRPIFLLLFQRLTSSKTVKFVKGLLVFFSVYIMKYSAAKFVELLDSIEVRFTAKVLDRIYISEVQKLTGNHEKNLCAMGIIKILCEVPDMISTDYVNYWAPLLQALIGLFELPEDTEVPADEHFAEMEDVVSYQTTYAKLNFIGANTIYPFKAQLQFPQAFLAQSLANLSANHPGRFPALIGTINPHAQEYLAEYLKLSGVKIV